MPEATALIPFRDPHDEMEDISETVLVPFNIHDKAYRHPSRRYLVSFDSHGNPRCKEVPSNACIVTGSDPVSVWTFLREFVYPEVIPEAHKIISQRTSHILEVGMEAAARGWLRHRKAN